MNSDRFLSAYNQIDHRLRQLARQNKETRFYSLVDTVSKTDPIVKRYKFDLKEYADLRNAIVHERTDGHVIAEPNNRAVKSIETIANMLTNPPKVIPFFKCEAHILSVGDPVAKAVKIMFERSFSQMPVYDTHAFEGLLTTNTITRWLGANVGEDIFSLAETTVSQVLGYAEDKDDFLFLKKDSTLFEILEGFEKFDAKGKRLEAILITQNGKPTEKLLRIITIWDLPKIYSFLGNHS